MNEMIKNNEELVLASKKIENKEEIAESALTEEKYDFMLWYTANHKEKLLEQVQSIGCYVKNISENYNAVIVKCTMKQLKAIKQLDFVEKIEVNTTNTFEESPTVAEYVQLTKAMDNDMIINSESVTDDVELSEVEPLSEAPEFAVMAAANGSSMGNAINLTVTKWANSSIACSCDEKWFKFTANAKEAHNGNSKGEYTIRTSGSLDTIGILYNASGNQIAYNDDYDGNLNFSITAKLSYGATYYVKVSTFGSNTGSFKIVVGYTAANVFNPSAIYLNQNERINGYINCACGEAWFKFKITGNTGTYYIHTEGNLDTIGTLYDSKGNRIAEKSDGYTGANFCISACLTKGETYFVCVRAYRNNTGSFILTFVDNIPAKSISILTKIDRFDLGTNATLRAMVLPSCATNNTVLWSSSNKKVATIDRYSGFISCIGEGTTNITATLEGGWCSDSFLLEVRKEFVTIKKDESNPYFNKMIFESSQKTWYCMDLDMIYDEENSVNTVYTKRAMLNVKDKNGNYRNYTDEEIKLIFAVDPYGLAYYVKERAAAIGSLKGILDYKDRIFSLIYNRQPSYYFRDFDGTWYPIAKKDVGSNLSSYASESETLFGFHPIYDGALLLDALSLAIDIISIAVAIKAMGGKKGWKAVKRILTIAQYVIAIGETVLKDQLLEFVEGAGIDCLLDNTKPEWISIVVSSFETYGEVFDVAELIVSKPTIYPELIYYCTCKVNYDIYIENTDGSLKSLKTLNEALKQIN